MKVFLGILRYLGSTLTGEESWHFLPERRLQRETINMFGFILRDSSMDRKPLIGSYHSCHWGSCRLSRGRGHLSLAIVTRAFQNLGAPKRTARSLTVRHHQILYHAYESCYTRAVPEVQGDEIWKFGE